MVDVTDSLGIEDWVSCKEGIADDKKMISTRVDRKKRTRLIGSGVVYIS